MPEDHNNEPRSLIEEIIFRQGFSLSPKNDTEIPENKTLQRLKAVEFLNRSILETSLECVIAINHLGEVLEFNAAAERTFGYARKQIIGKPLADFIIPSHLRESHLQGISRYLASKESRILNKRLEFSATRADGTEFPIELTVTRLSFVEPPIFVGYIRDMTERNHAQEALEKGEKRFRSLIEQSFDMVAVLSAEGRIVYTAGAVFRILGYSNDELVGRNAFDRADSADREKAETVFKKLLQFPDKSIRVEIRAVHKDGSSKWVEVLGQNLLNDPSVGGIVANIRDITERREAEIALRTAEERYRSIIENAVEGIFQTTPDGLLLMVNPAYARMFGYDTPEEMMTAVKDVAMIYAHPEQRAEIIRLLNEQGIVKGFEGKAYRRDGGIFWISSNVRAVRDPRGNLLYLEGSLEDISRRKELEDQILQAQKLESLGILAGGIAHDFNNILTSILGNISLAKSLLESKELLLNRLTEAEKASLRASDLAQQLLTFSKGGAPIKRLISIQSIILHSVQFALAGSNIQSRFVFQEGLWPVEVDEGQISQVIQNLVINAQQAMPAGGTILLEAKNLTFKEINVQGLNLRKGDYVLISIHDQGTGISKEHLSKIFDPYFTTKQKGSGLGLSITYSIIQRHQGTIFVESSPGLGTTFFIYLPASSQSHLAPEKLETQTMSRGKGRILVMDDEDSILQIAESILKHLGYKVDLAKNGSEALRIYQTAKDSGDPFDLVITDLTVPGDIGGIETLRRLQGIDPRVKVIVSSGYANDPAIANLKDSGFSGCLKKPYRAFEVSEVVKRVIAVK